METKNNKDNPTMKEASMMLTPETAAFLLKAAKWGKFLAILGFIVTGLMLTVGILMTFILSIMPEDMVPLSMPSSTAVSSVLFIVMSGIYLVPVVFLNSFCNNAIKAVNQTDSEFLAVSIRNLKNLFVFTGILTIVLLAIYTLLLLIIGSAAIIGF